MKLYKYPQKSEWNLLIQRPTYDNDYLEDNVREILEQVKMKGDEAIKTYTKQFDNVEVNEFIVSNEEIVSALSDISEELKLAISIAANNIRAFHSAQQVSEARIETMPGVICWRKAVGIEKVGLYIPGGSAPLFSTILMLGIPAQLAGCKEVILCTPCDKNGKINSSILYTAHILGINKIYKIGGAQAIAAMAYGTKTVPAVQKIFGPGNQYVTKAKELVQQQGIAIDMPAGPSEVLVIADANANPDFIAADLLAQAEHGPDSQVILLSNSEKLISEVETAVRIQLNNIPRRNIANLALKNSAMVLLSDIKSCFEWSNLYAPEHLILNLTNPESYLDLIVNAGSVFLGPYTCESAGDYASGTNHTLPTNGYARSYSGVSIDSFVKKITFQTISAEGLKLIGSTIETMADAEQLQAHKMAVTIRLNKLN